MVSRRDPRTGSVLWRFDACGGVGVGTGGGRGEGRRVQRRPGVSWDAVLAAPSRGGIVTLDADGALRGWDEIDADVFEGAEGGGATEGGEA